MEIPTTVIWGVLATVVVTLFTSLISMVFYLRIRENTHSIKIDTIKTTVDKQGEQLEKLSEEVNSSKLELMQNLNSFSEELKHEVNQTLDRFFKR